MTVPVNFGRLRVVLVATRNPLNLGAAARAMSNFGIAHLRVVNPYQVAFREARSAVGASGVLTEAEEYGSVAEAVADCSIVVGTTAVGNRELRHPLRSLESAAGLIRKRLRSGRVALLFGPEKTGLSNEDFSYCHWLLHIPTYEENISMNLGQAVAVCLYELTRGTKPTDQPERQIPATAADVERITSMLQDALCLSGYLNGQRTPESDEKTRRLIRRLRMPTKDAHVWLGMLRQILWNLRSSGN